MDGCAADPEEWQQAIVKHYKAINGNDDNDFPVRPENWQTVRIFLSLSSCWRQDSMSGRFLALSRQDIESTLNMWNIRPAHKRAMLENLLVMESAAIEVVNRK